ncbi:hypothetical protein BDF19DRAFT_190246 [Syncephalis fuscata]|nr:hypothetical protein BDF19DRAFT_190246 [Syncephalis fuscata]
MPGMSPSSKSPTNMGAFTGGTHAFLAQLSPQSISSISSSPFTPTFGHGHYAKSQHILASTPNIYVDKNNMPMANNDQLLNRHPTLANNTADTTDTAPNKTVMATRLRSGSLGSSSSPISPNTQLLVGAAPSPVSMNMLSPLSASAAAKLNGPPSCLPPSPYSPYLPSPLNRAAVQAANAASFPAPPQQIPTEQVPMGSFLNLLSPTTPNIVEGTETEGTPQMDQNTILFNKTVTTEVEEVRPASLTNNTEMEQPTEDKQPEPKEDDAKNAVSDNDSDDFDAEYNEREEQANQKRTNAMRELVHTERTYVKGLRYINRNYIQPLRAQVDSSASSTGESDWTAPLASDSNETSNGNNWVSSVINNTIIRGLSSRDVHMLFANLEDILVLHEGMLADLEKRFADWDVVDPVSDIIQMRLPQFRQYFLYIRNYPQAMSLLDRLTKQSANFRRFLAQSNNGKEDNSKMIAYLTMPTSRVTRYIEFLRTMCANMSSFHPDYQDLIACTGDISSMTAQVKYLLTAMENKRKVLDVQTSLTGFNGNLITERRRLMYTGELAKVNPASYAHESRIVFLFNDLILWAKVTAKGERQYRGLRELPFMEISDLIDTRYYCNTIQVGSGENMVLLAATTPEDKEHWSSLLRQAVKSCRKLQAEQHRRYKEAHVRQQQQPQPPSQQQQQQQQPASPASNRNMLPSQSAGQQALPPLPILPHNHNIHHGVPPPPTHKPPPPPSPSNGQGRAAPTSYAQHLNMLSNSNSNSNSITMLNTSIACLATAIPLKLI